MSNMARLDELRGRIDDIDSDILRLLAERGAVVRAVAEVKRELGLTALQQDRFNQLKARLHEQGPVLGVSPELVDDVWEVIHKHSIGQQEHAGSEEN